ncbi:MAG: hypothetical protein M3537_11075 [Chloroflexota bacterium]|nr:hypothetical protein [Chloroflexota bacterium]
MSATAPTAAAEPAKPAKDTKATTYVVLRESKQPGEGLPRYEHVGNYPGTADQAIRRAAMQSTGSDGDTYQDGMYFAIPARSFKPVTLTTSTETKVTLS